MGDERCQRYDREEQRMCRNKVFQGHLCKRHVIEDLKRYETENPMLLWYLANRHLIGEAGG